MADWGSLIDEAGNTTPEQPFDLEGYIAQAAQARGIEPDVALRVARSEGLKKYIGDNGTSFGPFQLHYGSGGRGFSQAGMGNDFTAATGLDARDPATVKQQVDFALDRARENGWGPWYGAKRAGITGMQGITQQPPSQNWGSMIDQAGASLPSPRVPMYDASVVNSPPDLSAKAAAQTGREKPYPGMPLEQAWASDPISQGLEKVWTNPDVQTGLLAIGMQPELAAIPEISAGLGAAKTNKALAEAATPPPPKSTALRKAESRLDYMAAEQSGMALSPGGYDRMVQGINYKLTKMGMNPEIHPKSSAALRQFQEAVDRGGKPDAMSALTGTVPRQPSKQMSLQELETLRQVASDATQATDAADRERARILTDRFDEFLDNLKPADLGISAGPHAKEGIALLNRARQRWAQMRRNEDLDAMMERAQIKGGQLAGGSLQGLITEFRQLATKITRDKREAARWSPEQQQIIKQMANPGSTVNFLRALSRLSPRHYFSMTGGGVLGLGGFAAGGIAGLAPTAIGWGVGEAANAGANALMRNKLDYLRGTIGE